jgi:hypothetical protein
MKHCAVHGPINVPDSVDVCPLAISGGQACSTKLEVHSEEPQHFGTSIRASGIPQSDTVGHDYARTRARQGAFLAAYANSSRIDLSAEAAGIARSTHYEWLKRDFEYPALFAEAEELAAATLMDETVRRARDGWDEPITVAGEKVMVRRYSDRLMERLLEAKFPVLFRSNLAHRLVDDKGKDRDVISFEAIDRLIREADARDRQGEQHS